MDHVVVLLIGLPDTASNPCSANSRPASATITPTTKTMALRIPSTLTAIAWRGIMLPLKTLIGTSRYQVSDHGLDTAKVLTTLHDRIQPTGLAELAAAGPASSRLKAAATAYRTAIDTLATTTQFAA